MKECFTFGLAMGVIVGAILVHTSPKVQKFMEKGEKMVKEKIEEIKDKNQ